MPKMQTLVMVNYESDFAGNFSNVPVKIRTGYNDCYIGFGYGPKPQNICPVASIFSPRYLEATFGPNRPAAQGAKIKFPVNSPDTATITALVNELKACGADCVDLKGEYWNVVPPAIGGYTVGTQRMTLTDGTFSQKRSGRAVYNSDGLGPNQLVPVAYEIEPTPLSDQIDNCIGPLDPAAVCTISGIKARHAIAKGSVDNAFNNQSTFARKAPIDSRAEILNCMAAVGNLPFVQCVGYRGESIARIDLLV